MVDLDIELFIKGVSTLGHLRQSASEFKNGVPDGTPDLVNLLSDLCAHLDECGLSVSGQNLAEIVSMVADAHPLSAIATEIHIFNMTLIREFRAKAIFMLPSEQARYNHPARQLFGELVCDAFPSAVTDIEEAGKCLAFGRGTAGVFHLMRVMEAGLKSLAAPLGIPYAPSWDGYLKQITDRVNQKHAAKGIKWKQDESFFRDCLGDLQGIKIAWRNPTMHIDRRYTPEEADDVFRAVRTLMVRLAGRFGENLRPRRRKPR